MNQYPEQDSVARVDRLSYDPMHNYRTVDVDAWAEQWFSGYAGLDPDSENYRATQSMMHGMLYLHPTEREIDVQDLNFGMGMLRLIGQRNPHDLDSESPQERLMHEQWGRMHEIALLIARQIVRVTLDDGEHYAALRLEQERSGTDYLTGLPNRRGLYRRIQDQYGITDAPERRSPSGELLGPAELIYVYGDMNNLKWINDNLGHQVGDAAIVEAAWDIQDSARRPEATIIYRDGGDEFGAVIGDMPRKEVDAAARRVTKRQVDKATSDEYRDAMRSIGDRINVVRQSGWSLRIEARRSQLTQAEISAGQRPYHVLYINGTAITEVRNIITLAIGVKSALVSNLGDLEVLRHNAEEVMRGAKDVFRSIMENLDLEVRT